MPTIPLPPMVPIPWPAPGPGIGIPIPSPAPAPVPNPGTTITPSPGAAIGGGVIAPFAKLFQFAPDWVLIGALVLVAFTVDIVDQTYPEYVWMYVGILLLGIILTSSGFTPQLNRWLGP